MLSNLQSSGPFSNVLAARKITLRLNWSQLLQPINEGHELKLLLLRGHSYVKRLGTTAVKY